MRWIPFLVLAAVLVTVQSVLAPCVEVLSARPDWALAVVLFFALYSRPRDAIIAAWIIGGLADLMTIERLGLIALSYGLAASIVCSSRDYVFRDRKMTRWIVTFLACLLVRCGWLAYRRIAYGPLEAAANAVLVDGVLAAAYTACWAVPIHACLDRMRRLLGVRISRPTGATEQRAGALCSSKPRNSDLEPCAPRRFGGAGV